MQKQKVISKKKSTNLVKFYCTLYYRVSTVLCNFPPLSFASVFRRHIQLAEEEGKLASFLQKRRRRRRRKKKKRRGKKDTKLDGKLGMEKDIS